MPKPANQIMWNMTRKCNFHCEYCYFPHVSPPVRNALAADDVLRFLNGTGRSWNVVMTGGEPLLYPDFVTLCARLCENHRISIDTNLSLSPQVRKFAERIAPDRVEEFYVSLHVRERERVNGVAAFLENIRILKECGFTVCVNYVLYPEFVERFSRDLEFYGEHGIALRPIPFKGTYQGRSYPEAYSEEARQCMELYPGAGAKMVYNFYGIPCEGGCSFLRMEPDGTIFRCSGERTVLGNIRTEVRLYEQAEPCGVTRCPCRGVKYVVLSSAQRCFLQGLKMGQLGRPEQAIEKYTKTLGHDSNHSAACNNIGIELWKLGSTHEARQFFLRAHELQPEEPTYILNVAVSLAEAGAVLSAREYCRAYLTNHMDADVSELQTVFRNYPYAPVPRPRLCLRVQH